MTLKRLEIRLRSKNPMEQEFIEALEEQDGIYGAKNELMRACLHRGYMVLEEKMESLSAVKDEEAALNALAQIFASGEYGYRLAKSYLETRKPLKGKAKEPLAGGNTLKEAESVSLEEGGAGGAAVEQTAASLEVPTPQEALDAVATGVAPVIAEVQAAQSVMPSVSPPALAVGVEKTPPSRKVAWSKMRGLAGSDGGSGTP